MRDYSAWADIAWSRSPHQIRHALILESHDPQPRVRIMHSGKLAENPDRAPVGDACDRELSATKISNDTLLPLPFMKPPWVAILKSAIQITVMAKKGEKDKKTRGLPNFINRKALHDYEVLDRFEAGISLAGQEVKSIRAGGVSLTDSYARVMDDEVLLLELNIAQYKFTTCDVLNPRRPRRLLLNKREIRKIRSRIEEKGMTLIPLKIYFKGHLVKVELGLCRGKRLYEKRDSLARKDAAREKDRALRERDE